MASSTSLFPYPTVMTAAPETKSRNTFPSTSSTYQPAPVFGTNGRYRQLDCISSFSSDLIIALAFGPGGLASIFGRIYPTHRRHNICFTWSRHCVLPPEDIRQSHTLAGSEGGIS